MWVVLRWHIRTCAWRLRGWHQARSCSNAVDSAPDRSTVHPSINVHPLAAVNQHTEAAQYGCSLRAGPFGGSSRSCAKIRSVQEQTVCLAVEAHGFGSHLGLDGVDYAVFVG